MESTSRNSLLSPNSQHTVISHVDETSNSAHPDVAAHLKDDDFLGFVEDAEPFSGYHAGGYHPVHLGERYGDGGRYKMLHKLGNGTYSTVWLAEDLATIKSRYVALKILIAGSPSMSISRHDRLKWDHHYAPTEARHSSIDATIINEIRILQRLSDPSSVLSHPGSARILSLVDHFIILGPNGAHHVLATEVTGPRLSSLQKPSAVIRKLCRQLVEGVDYLHQHGITHGDLHPGNVVLEMPNLDGQLEEDILARLGSPICGPVVTKGVLPQSNSLPHYVVQPSSFEEWIKETIKNKDFQWNIKLIDYGAAYFANDKTREVATPLVYRAPEALFYSRSSGQTDENWDHRVDIWALGCVIYKLITNDTLFPQYFESEEELITDWAWALGGPLPARWSPYYDARNLRFAPDGTLIDAPDDPDLTLSQKVHNRFERLDPQIAGSPEDLIDLLQKMLVFEPAERQSARDLLKHRWFQSASEELAQ